MPHNDGFSGGQSRRISRLTGNTTILAGGLLTFVGQDGVNYKIAFDDFLNVIGTTGSLTQSGSVLGTPVLDGILTDYKIRNLEDGPGITTSVSPENGLTVRHNFANPDSGAQILKDPDTNPLIRSLIAGQGIAVAAAGDSIQISVSGTPVTTKTVTVNQLSDFPDPVGGVRTLLDDTQYFLTNDISTSDTFILGDGTVLSSSSSGLITLSYTGVGAFLTTGAGITTISNISVNTPTGAIFQMNGAGTGTLGISSVTFTGNKLGFVDSPAIFAIRSASLSMIDGVTFSGLPGAVVLLESFVSTISAGTLFDLGSAVFNSFSVENCLDLSPSGSTFISGLPNSGNVAVGRTASIISADFEGGIVGLSGITEDDDRWNFLFNSEIRDTRRDAIISTQSNVTVTTFSGSGVPTKVLATWAIQRLSGYTADATGTITQAIGKGAVTPITISISAQANAGGNPTYRFYVTVNGTPVSASSVGVQLSNSSPSSITLVWQEVLEDADTIELWVENETNTTTCTVVDSVFRVD